MAIRMFNHHLFLCVCSNLHVVPKGLVIKKSPCVGEISQSSFLQWNVTLNQAGLALVQILKEEYRSKLRESFVKFWNMISASLESMKSIAKFFTDLLFNAVKLQERKYRY